MDRPRRQPTRLVPHIARDESGPPPIGRPVANTRLYVLDRHQELVATGMTGELYIGGIGVARGYLNRPDLTVEHFVPDSFAVESSARLYRTGDLARWGPGGKLQFLGRVDPPGQDTRLPHRAG